MNNLEQVLYDLVRPMVDHPEDLRVEETAGEDSRDAVLHVNPSQEDIARLIGR